jgi:Cdc6-like AAA superfamily ATPase
VALYATVLKYQATAACHFGRKTLPRMFANIITANDWTGMLKQVRTADNNCQAFIAIKSTQEVLKQIQEIPQGFDRELYKKWQQDKIRSDEILRQWINNRIEASEAHQEEIEKIISWISDVKVGQDHAALREKLGASYWNSGQWLLNPSEGEQNHFENWKLSRHGQLWLQGSVGTGKSSLVSIVINHLIESSPQNRLAFYYCSRNSAENTPVTILRGLVAQLAWSADGLEISDHVKKMYKKQSARRLMESPLSISDCVDLFVTLIKLHGPTIVVIDGLDECEGPMKLLWKLFEVWSRSQQLKVFLSSREGVEVTKVFSEALIIRTESEKSSDDIRKYITNELNRKERRNETVISEELAGRMVSILTLLAEGM